MPYYFVLNLNLMKRSVIIFLIFFLLQSFSSSGQIRYKDVISEFVKTETYTYANKNGEDLGLDIYLPLADSITNRYVYLFVHGGGFSGGTRDAGLIPDFCKNIARRGYVAVSISYRLTRKDKPSRFGCDCPAEEKLNTFRSAVEDIHDATAFLIKNRDKFGLDPEKIILSGGSAGAEAVLNAAYEPWTPDGHPVKYAGVVSLAGAIPDTTVITEETAIPSLFFHGTCDPLVPYATAPHHYCDKTTTGYLILNGSYSIAAKLDQLNKPYWLHTTCGGSHSLAGTPMTQYFDEILYFCYRFVVQGVDEQIRTVIPGDQDKCDYKKYVFCDK